MIVVAGKRTDRSVLEVPCPHCGAAKGTLCIGAAGIRKGSTHYKRRNNATALRRGKPLPWSAAESRRTAEERAGIVHRIDCDMDEDCICGAAEKPVGKRRK